MAITQLSGTVRNCLNNLGYDDSFIKKYILDKVDNCQWQLGTNNVIITRKHTDPIAIGNNGYNIRFSVRQNIKKKPLFFDRLDGPIIIDAILYDSTGNQVKIFNNIGTLALPFCQIATEKTITNKVDDFIKAFKNINSLNDDKHKNNISELEGIDNFSVLYKNICESIEKHEREIKMDLMAVNSIANHDKLTHCFKISAKNNYSKWPCTAYYDKDNPVALQTGFLKVPFTEAYIVCTDKNLNSQMRSWNVYAKLNGKFELFQTFMVSDSDISKRFNVEMIERTKIKSIIDSSEENYNGLSNNKKHDDNEFIDNLIGDKIVSSLIIDDVNELTDDNVVNANNSTIDNLNSINLRNPINFYSIEDQKVGSDGFNFHENVISDENIVNSIVIDNNTQDEKQYSDEYNNNLSNCVKKIDIDELILSKNKSNNKNKNNNSNNNISITSNDQFEEKLYNISSKRYKK